MLTREQVRSAREFHHEPCVKQVGKRGGVTIKIEVWRRNGATQFWKTRHDHFRIPVKHGLKSFSNITHLEANQFHAAEDCPLDKPGGVE